MPVQATCPSCQTVCAIPEEGLGRKVRCKQCQTIFDAPKGDELAWVAETDAPPADGLRTEPSPGPGAKYPRAARPAKHIARSVERASPQRLHAAIWIAVGAVAALLLVGLGMTLALVFFKDKGEAKTTPSADASAGIKKEDKDAGPVGNRPEDRGRRDNGPPGKFQQGNVPPVDVPRVDFPPARFPRHPRMGFDPWAEDKLTGKAATVIPGELYDFLQTAVKEKRLADTPLIGFPIGDKMYRDSCAEGGILIGFQVGLGKFTNNDVVEALKPIYRTKTGEKMGDWIGPRPMSPITLKAKPGYVVGGFSAYRGLSIESLCLDFVKLEKGRLQLNDTYKSAWVGDRQGFRQPNNVPVQGYFFVGITGRYSHDNTPCSLGLTAVLRK